MFLNDLTEHCGKMVNLFLKNRSALSICSFLFSHSVGVFMSLQRSHSCKALSTKRARILSADSFTQRGTVGLLLVGPQGCHRGEEKITICLRTGNLQLGRGASLSWGIIHFLLNLFNFHFLLNDILCFATSPVTDYAICIFLLVLLERFSRLETASAFVTPVYVEVFCHFSGSDVYFGTVVAKSGNGGE